eukprot:364610-Chlamydomonas_euryale.AAC.3
MSGAPAAAKARSVLKPERQRSSARGGYWLGGGQKGGFSCSTCIPVPHTSAKLDHARLHPIMRALAPPPGILTPPPGIHTASWDPYTDCVPALPASTHETQQLTTSSHAAGATKGSTRGSTRHSTHTLQM